MKKIHGNLVKRFYKITVYFLLSCNIFTLKRANFYIKLLQIKILVKGVYKMKLKIDILVKFYLKNFDFL